MHFSQPYQNLMMTALNCEAADVAEPHQLLEKFPFITLYVPCYESEPNAAFLNAICAKPSPYIQAFKRSAYLSKELAAAGTPNHSFVKQYTAIEIPTKKVDLQSLLISGKTVLQPLNIEDVKIKFEAPSFSSQVRNFIRRHLHLS